MLASAAESVLLVVDIQPKFLAPIHEAERVLRRTEFLLRVAGLLGVPAFATEQYPERMGHTHEALLPYLETLHAPVEGKMRFSCLGCTSFEPWLAEQNREQVVVVGIETHICVTQTVIQLLELGYQPILAEDAISARTPAMHVNGIERMRAEGAVVAHTESVAYEWVGAADQPKFREMLDLVKEFA